MKININLKKRGVIFSSLFLLVISCSTLLKSIGGFNNPKVETIKSINSYISESPLDNNNFFFMKPSDSIELKKIILSSLNGEIIIFDRNGNKKCYNGKEKCSSLQISQIADNFEEHIGDCKFNEKEAFVNFNNINLLLNKLETSNKTKVLFNDFPKSDYYIIYYWSIFSGSKKNIEEDFLWFKKSLDKWDKNITILKVNCDLREDWDLQKNKKWSISFKKNKNNSYELIFGNIPYIHN